MERTRFRRWLALFIGSAWVLMMGSTLSWAEQKTQIAGRMVLTKKLHQAIEIDDTKGHALCLFEYVGINRNTGEHEFMDCAQAVNRYFADFVERTGPIQGYTKFSKMGDSIFAKWEGEMNTTRSPDGTLLMIFEGSYSIVGGTGQFANIEGSGTFKGKMPSWIVQIVEWEGEYSIKK